MVSPPRPRRGWPDHPRSVKTERLQEPPEDRRQWEPRLWQLDQPEPMEELPVGQGCQWGPELQQLGQPGQVEGLPVGQGPVSPQEPKARQLDWPGQVEELPMGQGPVPPQEPKAPSPLGLGLPEDNARRSELWAGLLKFFELILGDNKCPCHGICIVLDSGEVMDETARSLCEFGDSLVQLEQCGSAKNNSEAGHGGGLQEKSKRVQTGVDFGKVRHKRPRDQKV